jgi:NAD(P)-dependent dehydrogenase (short-subunit alcohol dehydrogenase family)
MRFENKVVLITGGTRGIGLATAKLFAREGARVVIVGRDENRTTEAAREVPGRGEAGDVSRAVDCQRIVTRTLDRYARIDVLINCAGVIFRNRTVEQTSEEEWDATFNVNVKGTFLMCKYALPAA